MGVGGQSQSPAALTPGKTKYRRLGGTQNRSGQVQTSQQVIMAKLLTRMN